MYIIFSSFVKFNATDKLNYKLFTQVIYVSGFVEYTVYVCIKYKIIMLFIKYRFWKYIKTKSTLYK